MEELIKFGANVKKKIWWDKILDSESNVSQVWLIFTHMYWFSLKTVKSRKEKNRNDNENQLVALTLKRL